MTREEAIEYAESKKMRLEALVYNDDCKYGNYAMYSDELSFVNAALSTLQAENAQLRAYLEYEREHADAYYEECGQWETENEKLRAELKQVKAERDAAAKKLTREAAEAALKGEQNG